MRSDLRITFPHITFPQEVDNLAHSLCAAARAAAAVPGAVRRGGTARPCPRGRLGAPGAVPVLCGRRAADRLSCRQGALAPSRAPAAPRFRPAAGRSRARRARSDRRLPGRRGGMRLAAARGTAVRLGRPARGAVLLVRKSRLLHRACRRHAVRFGENRRAALRHTGRLRPADRYFCFPWNGERTNDTGISRTFRQQTVLRRILLGRASWPFS